MSEAFIGTVGRACTCHLCRKPMRKGEKRMEVPGFFGNHPVRRLYCVRCGEGVVAGEIRRWKKLGKELEGYENGDGEHGDCIG